MSEESNGDWGELDSEIREVFAEGEAAEHPSSEELAAYARGELPEAEAERLRQHLGPCRECTAAVLALGLPRSGAAGDRLPDAEVAGEVEAIVSRVRESRAGGGRAGGRSRALLAAAAVLALACVALAWFAAGLRRQVGELEDALSLARAAPAEPASTRAATAPETGVPIVDLFPSSVARGEAAAPRVVSLGEAAMVALILTPPAGVTRDAYSLRILDAAGVELWRGPARRDPAGAFVVVMPRALAEAGVERVELHGADGAGGASERLLETYRVRFEP